MVTRIASIDAVLQHGAAKCLISIQVTALARGLQIWRETAMQRRLCMMGALGVQLWSCAALAIEPGAGFEARIDWPIFIQHEQVHGPAEVRFSVQQCEDFAVETVAVSQAPSLGWPREIRAKTPVMRVAQGKYTAVVAVDNMARGCATSRQERELHLVVTCRDGRVAKSNAIPLTYDAARYSSLPIRKTSHGFMLSSFHQLFGIGDPNRLFAVGDGVIGMYNGTREDEWQVQTVAISTGHVFRRVGGFGYLSGQCVAPNPCTPQTVTEPRSQTKMEVPAGHVYVIDLGIAPVAAGVDTPLLAKVVTVPGYVEFMAPDPEGGVRMLSVLRVKDSGSDYAVLGLREGRVTVHDVLLDVPFAFAVQADDGPFFATGVPGKENSFQIRSLLHGEATNVQIAGTGRPRSIRLSPDGLHWLVERKSGLYLGGARMAARRLEGPSPMREAAWTDHALATYRYEERDGEGIVIVSLYHRQNGDVIAIDERDLVQESSAVLHILTDEDRFVFSNPDGIRTYSEAGEFLSGTTLPTDCPVNPFDIVRMGEHRLAWLGRNASIPSIVYVFDPDPRH